MSALKRQGLLCMAYATSALFIAWGATQGLMPGWLAALQIGTWALVNAVFFLLIAFRPVRLADPWLTMPQVIFGIVAVASSYLLNPFLRGMALQMLVLLFVFDMRRLGEAQIRFAVRFAILLVVCAQALVWLAQGEVKNFGNDLICLAVAAINLPIVSFLARKLGAIRRRQEGNRQALNKALVRLKEVSMRDALTGAFNRRHGLEAAEAETSRQARGGEPCVLAIVDLDHFKRINDRFGHAVGDRVLVEFVQLAQAQAAPFDVFARWGGEEFLWVMPRCSVERARAKLAQLMAATDAHDWARDAEGLSLSFSAGVVAPRPTQALSVVLATADAALYRAKNAGRHCVHVGGADAGG